MEYGERVEGVWFYPYFTARGICRAFARPHEDARHGTTQYGCVNRLYVL